MIKKIGLCIAILCMLAACSAPGAESRSVHILDNWAENQVGGGVCLVGNWEDEIPAVTQLSLDGSTLMLQKVEDSDAQDEGRAAAARFVLLNLETGELLADAVLPEVLSARLAGNRVLVDDGSRCTVYDTHMVEEHSWEYSDAVDVDMGGHAIYFLRNGDPSVKSVRRDVFSFDIDRRETVLLAVDPATGEETPLLPNNKWIRRINSVAEDVVYGVEDLESGENTYISVDTDTGEMEEMPFSARQLIDVECRDGLWLARSPSVVRLGRDSNPSILLNEGDMVIYSLREDPSPVRALGLPGEMWQCAYHEDGSFGENLSGERYTGFEDSQSIASDFIWSETYGGYFFLGRDEGEESLYFAEGPFEEKGKPLDILTAEDMKPEPGKFVARELTERADEISRTYGVTVTIPDTEYESGRFRVEPNSEYCDLLQTLTSLDRAMARYPQGFFTQMLRGNKEYIHIQLMGEIHAEVPEDADGFQNFAAFVHRGENGYDMLLDSGLDDMETTIYHEFSHIIDCYLEEYSGSHATGYSEQGWADLNPRGFEYSDTYDYMTDMMQSPDFDHAFVDSYARTYATEDRARVMEYAMGGGDRFFDGNHDVLRQKLTYYSRCIRESFDTTGWPDVTAWEEPLA